MKCARKSCPFPAVDDRPLCRNHAREEEDPLTGAPPSPFKLERVIAAGINSFLQVADALNEIYERKLYLQAGFATYPEYCREKWSIRTSAAYNYLRARAVVEQLPPEQRESVTLTQAVQLARTPSAKRPGLARESSRTIARARSAPSKNADVLKQFTVFCQRNPQLEFWQAVEAFRNISAAAA